MRALRTQSRAKQVVRVSRASSRPWPQRLMPYLLIAPALLLILMFTVWPTTKTVIDSLYQPGRTVVDPNTGERTQEPEVFVGLENYAELFDNTHPLGARFPRILGNTLIFTLTTVIIAIPLALVMALLLNRRLRARPVWRFSMFYPTLLPMLGAASIFAFLYADTVGLINTVLRSFNIPTQNWLGDPDLVLYSIITVNIWKQTGFYMIFYLAGLQGIPKDIYEAAELDGAGYFQQFFRLTLPLLRRTTLFIVVISSTYAFQTVEQLQALNFGLPADRGNLLLYFIFQNRNATNTIGHVNAMTVILVGILLVFTITNFLFFERQEDEA